MTVRSLAITFLRGASKGAQQQQQAISKETVVELIQKAASQQNGVRKGWQTKAATWVKKVHIDRGDVKVGRFVNGRFQILQHLRPRYFVPADLDTFELRPYVEVEAPSKKTTDAGAPAAS